MRLSVSWLGVVLISSLLIYFLWYGKNIYEDFANQDAIAAAPEAPKSVSEGFAVLADNPHLNITTCPADSKMFINKQGISACCEGSINSDTCTGNTICSLSESSSGLPTCTEWYEAYLKARGNGKCPGSMPNYYEVVDPSGIGGSKGCTAGYLNKDGSGPYSTTDAFCNLYNTKQQNWGHTNSCENAIMLENAVCFPGSSIHVDKSLEGTLNGLLPAMITCKYGDLTTLTAGTCNTDDSIVRFMDGLFTLIQQYTGYVITLDSWKSGAVNWDPYSKLNFCSVTDKYKIKKTVGYAELPALRVF